jgi:hypothetical protein
VKLCLPTEVIGCDDSFEIFCGVDEENYCALRRYYKQSENFVERLGASFFMTGEC